MHARPDQIQALREALARAENRLGTASGVMCSLLGAIDGLEDDTELGRWVRTLRPRLLPFEELPGITSPWTP